MASGHCGHWRCPLAGNGDEAICHTFDGTPWLQKPACFASTRYEASHPPLWQGQGLAPIQAAWEGFYNYRPSLGISTQLFHQAQICLVLENESQNKKDTALDDISLPSDILSPTISKAVIRLVGQMLAKTFPGFLPGFPGSSWHTWWKKHKHWILCLPGGGTGHGYCL